ncbi:protein hu-li tai shao isoform X2 [Drosophila serrata]|uniref:protein hu-li tai shao isoform X2 n=1 Tax=Drosophila serrata TaxID=7274 RepID=UPI000A1D3449|nr:protein hu-li tai shao isoform X2 [Drosophila serrata]
MTEVEQPPQNGIDPTAGEEDDSNKARPADIEQDMREMERRKRVEAIMGSKLFREELERIVDSAREGGAGASGILQQLSDIVGVPVTRVGNVFKSNNCMVPINDIRGVESMGYAKGEKILRCKLAATFRLLDLNGWTQGLGAQITARLKVDQEYFLVNPYGLLYHEITASALNKVDMQGQIVEQGTTNFGVNKSHFVLHSVIHAARPDIRCAIYIGCSPVVAISSLKAGLLPLTKDACVLGEITTHAYTGLFDEEERNRLVRNLGPNSKVMLLANHGALCCGETIEEAYFAACHIVQACETQLKLLPVGVDNLVLIPEESRKAIYEQSRRPPEDLEKKFAAVTAGDDGAAAEKDEAAATPKIGSPPKWRVGGAEFEALMRTLDNAGYRTGYIYRHPLIKSDPPKPKNDVELPPAVSSLGYLLEEEELFRQGIWKKGDLRKGGDRSRWLNSPNVYQKVEVLETGTPDPKKITKWVAEGSPTHSTPVRIEDPLQFVPAGTNPREFKRVQQQIKDNRRADKISAGPQSHILEGVTWDEASRLKDATVSQTGDHVVMMGAASKGIIQRGFQHNATVYKAPYAKNPFDNVTDDELNEYKRTVERKKKSVHGEYTDTDFSESEAVLQAGTKKYPQSEPETEHQVIEIQTQQAPVPRQAEVVLSDALLLHLASKYEFLYSPNRFLTDGLEMGALEQQVYVIHKVEAMSKHSYPAVNMIDPSNVQNESGFSRNEMSLISSTPVNRTAAGRANSSLTGNQTLDSSSAQVPYRTISHFGFNSPLKNAPSIPLHPEHQSIWQAVAEQRERVVSFIDLTTLSLDNRRLLNVVTNQTQSQTKSQSFVSEKHIQLEVSPLKRKQRVYSVTTTSSGHSADDSLEELESMMSGLAVSSPRRPEQQDSGLYRSYTFLPSNHVLPGGSTETNAREQPEADQQREMFLGGGTDDSGLGNSSGRRQRLVTTSNDSSTQEAEAYTQGKHVRLTLSSSPSTATAAGGAGQLPTTIEILINVSLRNAECIETVQTHEQEFRAKLEKVIDEEIHYISQQLAYQQRQKELHQQVQQANNRAPLASPTSSPPSSLLQRCNSAPALCHTYSYVEVAMAGSDMPPPPPPKPVEESLPSLPMDTENSEGLLISLEKELERLLNSVVKAHMMHNKAIIHDCRTRISQMHKS